MPGARMPKPRTGLYPGTFDPITAGHYDIVRRAARMVDHLIIGVASNAGKGPLFQVEERVALIQDCLSAYPIEGATVEVRPFGTLLVDFARDVEADVIVRGLRAVSDFEYEFEMAMMNKRLNDQIETAFLMASEAYQFTSSRFVKEIGRLGGDISSLVPPLVRERLLGKIQTLTK
jgi:pantetheine-phosphate adenylyltransferase